MDETVSVKKVIEAAYAIAASNGYCESSVEEFFEELGIETPKPGNVVITVSIPADEFFDSTDVHRGDYENYIRESGSAILLILETVISQTGTYGLNDFLVSVALEKDEEAA